MTAKQKGLGRGLDILINDNSPNLNQNKPSSKDIKKIKITELVPSPWQPRSIFNSEALNELVNSIKVHGILQPLIVRIVDNSFELIAGERRWRASQEAGLTEVPVIVVEANDEKALEIALIENLQREDLNAIEEAEGYALLQKTFNLTQEHIAERVGKARASVANALRLLDLSKKIRKQLSDNLISVGHAKVLLSINSIEEQERLSSMVIKDNLSIKKLELIIKKLGLPAKKKRAERSDLPNDYLHSLNDDLHRYFGTRVKISPSKTLSNGKKIKGILEIDFHNNDELDRILDIIGYNHKFNA